MEEWPAGAASISRGEAGSAAGVGGSTHKNDTPDMVCPSFRLSLGTLRKRVPAGRDSKGAEREMRSPEMCKRPGGGCGRLQGRVPLLRVCARARPAAGPHAAAVALARQPGSALQQRLSRR